MFPNIFTSNIFTMASLTAAINRIPNQYRRVSDLGLFPEQGVTFRTVAVEELNGTLNLLSSKPVGAPGQVGHNDKRSVYTFRVPHYPFDDAVLPEEVDGIRVFGSENALEGVAAKVAEKLARMKAAHDQTKEYSRVCALQGLVKDGAGTTLVDIYNAFGITKKAVDIDLDTAGTDVRAKLMEVKRHIETNLKGLSMQRVHSLVSPEFFDKLVSHADVKEAYKYFLNSGQTLSGDYRKLFSFGDVTFEEYNATMTLSDGSTTTVLIPANDAVFFPIGARIGQTYNAPADFNETVNTIGIPIYAKSEIRKFGRGTDIHTQSNFLPLLERPDVVVRGYTG